MITSPNTTVVVRLDRDPTTTSDSGRGRSG
jgi:hypothetical protein